MTASIEVTNIRVRPLLVPLRRPLIVSFGTFKEGPFLAIELLEGADQFVEITLHDVVELVEGQPDTMIGQSILGEVIGSDPFVASSGSDQSPAGIRAGGM